MSVTRETMPPPLTEGAIGHYGIIAKNAADFTTLVPVILPDFDETLQWGPCWWQSRDSTTLPAKGDVCFVQFDNRRNPWIVAWWPF